MTYDCYEFLNVPKRYTLNCDYLYIVFVSSPRHTDTKDDRVTAYLRRDVKDKTNRYRYK